MAFRSLLLAFLSATALATLDIDTTPNAVGIAYSVWHDLGYDKDAPPDITEIHDGNGNYSGISAFHYWGRPQGGYYPGGDRAVLRRHFRQISGAGIDFIAIDATNLVGYGKYHNGLFTEPTDVLISEMASQRAQNRTTPHVVFWVRTGHGDPDPSAVGRFAYDRYMKNPAYAHLWVELDGKPLMLTTDKLPSALYAKGLTLRKMWGLQDKLDPGEWSFLQDAPQNVGMDPHNSSIPEQVSVACAKQENYMTNTDSATPRHGGETYATQWARAFDVKPKVVMLTWWNEWIAQRQANDAEGNVQFVDAYDGEYSRDIEPQDPTQAGSHGTSYLRWTEKYVKAYKANDTLPAGLTGYA